TQILSECDSRRASIIRERGAAIAGDDIAIHMVVRGIGDVDSKKAVSDGLAACGVGADVVALHQVVRGVAREESGDVDSVPVIALYPVAFGRRGTADGVIGGAINEHAEVLNERTCRVADGICAGRIRADVVALHDIARGAGPIDENALTLLIDPEVA